MGVRKKETRTLTDLEADCSRGMAMGLLAEERRGGTVSYSCLSQEY